MAGNKYNPPRAIHKPDEYTLHYPNAQGYVETLRGNPKQIITHILNQQL